MTKGNVVQEDRWNAQQIPASPTANVLTWTRSYDGYGNLTDIFEPASDGEPARRTRIEYNASPMRDIPRFVRMLESGQHDAKSLATTVVPIDRMLEAYEEAAYRTTVTAIITA